MDEASEGDKGEVPLASANLQDALSQDEPGPDKVMEAVDDFEQDASRDKQSNDSEGRFEVGEPMDEFAPEEDENEERSKCDGDGEDDESASNTSSVDTNEKEGARASKTASSSSSEKLDESENEQDRPYDGIERLDKDEIIDEVSINFVSELSPEDQNAVSHEACENHLGRADENSSASSAEEQAKNEDLLLESSKQGSDIKADGSNVSHVSEDAANDTLSLCVARSVTKDEATERARGEKRKRSSGPTSFTRKEIPDDDKKLENEVEQLNGPAVEIPTASAAALPTAARLTRDFRKVLKLPSLSVGDRLSSEQVFKGALPTYVPCVPKRVSERLVASLSESDLEQLVCPGCKDRFLLPSSFLQHVYRRSVRITLACAGCAGRTLVFSNRCRMRMHILSHLEKDGVSVVAADRLDVAPPEASDLDVGFVDDTFAAELDEMHKEYFAEQSAVQCSECKVSLKSEELRTHFDDFSKSSQPRRIECDQCTMMLPNDCSLSAHIRIHSRQKPFVCPECGTTFLSWESFSRHAQDSCAHHARVLTVRCKLCPAQPETSAFVDVRTLAAHFCQKHVKIFFKCTECPRAFANKEDIYRHRESEHKQDSSKVVSAFSLLYKAPFLKPPGNLFASRESLERRLQQLTARWETRYAFSCFACRSVFATAEEISDHGSRWCQLMTGRKAAPATLFEHSRSEASQNFLQQKIDQVLSQLHDLCPEGKDCANCKSISQTLKEHLVSKPPMAPVESSDDGEAADEQASPPRNTKRSSKRIALTPTVKSEPDSAAVNNSTGKRSAVKGNSFLSPSAAVSLRSKAASQTNRSISVEQPDKELAEAHVKPLVECLGFRVPTSKSALAINRLEEDALALGSSVVSEAKKKVSKLKQKVRRFSCGLCSFNSDCKESFGAHIRVHQPAKSNGGESFEQCVECGMCFASGPALRKHLFLLHAIKMAEQDMGKPIETDETVLVDAITDEEGSTMFQSRRNVCSVCALAFSSPAELGKHFRSHGMAFLKSSSTVAGGMAMSPKH